MHAHQDKVTEPRVLIHLLTDDSMKVGMSGIAQGGTWYANTSY